MVGSVLARIGVDWSVLKKRRMFHLALLIILSVGLQVAFAVADNVTSGGCGYGGGNCVVPCAGHDAYGNVHCDGYVGSDGYVHDDAYPGCNGYVSCDGYVGADGYVGCTATSNDGSSVGCDAYVVCNWIRCDAYPRCPSVGCTGYPGGCPSDLVVTGADIPDTLNKGDTVDISWDVMNAGAGTASGQWGGGWGDEVYLSQSGAIDQYSTMIGYYYHSDSLSAGDSYSVTRPFAVGNIPNGEYFVIIKTDYWGAVYESNETNNQLVLGQRITVQGDDPDLTITSLNAADIVYKGESTDISFTVQNQGQGLAVAIQDPSCVDGGVVAASVGADGYAVSSGCSRLWDMVYLSSDNVLDEQDKSIGHVGHPDNVAPGDSYEVTIPVTIANVASGDYYIIVMADRPDGIFETNEDNNVAVSPITVTGPDPDLVPTAINAPDVAGAGQSINASWTVYNQGEGTAFGGWYDNLYFSTDATLDSSDYWMTNGWQSGPLPAGDSYTSSGWIWSGYNAWIPNVAPGTYYLIVRTDPTSYYPWDMGDRVFESNEDNNVLVRQITVTAPDLTVTSISAPDTVTAGSNFNASWTVYNDGDANAVGSWYDGLYISSDSNLDSSDTQIGWGWQYRSSSWDPLLPGSSYTNSYSAYAPSNLAPGTYYLIASTDTYNYVTEGDESNNRLVRQITISAPSLPDLTPTSLDAPETADSGSAISASMTVYNQGNSTTSSSWYDGLYLSTDSQYDYSDTYLGDYYHYSWMSVSPGGNYGESFNVSLPAVPPGTYYLVGKADSYYWMNESNENNNTISRQITITEAPKPDLVVSSFYAPDAVRSSLGISAAWTVYNQGDGPVSSGYWYDGIYLSNDDQLDSGDVYYDWTYHWEWVTTGGSYTNFQSVPLSSLAPGTYYLIVKADFWYNAVSESNEDNNTMARRFVIDDTPPVISDVTVTPQPCGSVIISWNTDEPTTGAAQADYLGFSQTSDEYLGTSHTIEIRGRTPGSTYPVTVHATDEAGNVSSASGGSFTAPVTGKPALSLNGVSVFWASYADYSQRLLSVTYSLHNGGADSAYGVAFTGSDATNGVTLDTDTPMLVGDVAPGATTNVPVKYYVPEGVHTFDVVNTFSGEDACGTSYVYPE